MPKTQKKVKKNNGKTGTSSGKVSVKPSPPIHKLKTMRKVEVLMNQ
ncbi:hypothetical protein [Paenibacillus durus]|nr:hypothetical protein [Paenibacillus durus]